MLYSSQSTIIGILFAATGATTVWLIFHATARMKQKGSSTRLIQAHRIGGYVFAALFCVMTYYMVLRLRDIPDELSARPMTHMILALVLIPLLFVKILIARFYKSSFYSALLPLGLTIFSVSFVLVAMTAGPYLLRRATVEDISLESIAMGNERIDVAAAQTLMQQRCDKCHNLDRVVGARKDARGWLTTVNRMRALPGSNISTDEAKTIVAYLVSRVGVDSSTPQGEQTAGKALVDSRCAKCHTLQQVYTAFKPADEWRTTVDRMVGYAPEGHFKPGETDAIVQFLSETQTPEAKNKQAATPVAGATSAPPPPPQASGPASGSDSSLYLVLVVVGTAFGALALRRPKGPTPAPAAAPAPSRAAAQPAARSGRQSFMTTLARIEQRTHDTKTFRFLLPEGERLAFKPGQFMTFDFMVDGKKAVRSYAICSSAMQTGYFEITVKRVAGGLVSNFLHDRAQVGMKVEARGPAGKTIFDETRQSRVVLVVGGSGITPAMSILRTLDDKCQPLDVTLVFCVRTPNDVVFGEELDVLKGRLPHLTLVVLVSRPDDAWTGRSGRIGREVIEEVVPDPRSAMFFLCGPPAFMDSAREIFHSLGVPDSQILQDTFGGPKAVATEVESSEVEGRVRFATTDVECDIPRGRSLLEVAEMNNVPIPSSCRQGQCGTCATRLLEGDVEMDAEDGLDASLKQSGFVLTCVGRAKGDVVLDV